MAVAAHGEGEKRGNWTWHDVWENSDALASGPLRRTSQPKRPLGTATTSAFCVCVCVCDRKMVANQVTGGGGARQLQNTVQPNADSWAS